MSLVSSLQALVKVAEQKDKELAQCKLDIVEKDAIVEALSLKVVELELALEKAGGAPILQHTKEVFASLNGTRGGGSGVGGGGDSGIGGGGDSGDGEPKWKQLSRRGSSTGSRSSVSGVGGGGDSGDGEPKWKQLSRRRSSTGSRSSVGGCNSGGGSESGSPERSRKSSNVSSSDGAGGRKPRRRSIPGDDEGMQAKSAFELEMQATAERERELALQRGT